jgi:hypothetical protein
MAAAALGRTASLVEPRAVESGGGDGPGHAVAEISVDGEVACAIAKCATVVVARVVLCELGEVEASTASSTTAPQRGGGGVRAWVARNGIGAKNRKAGFYLFLVKHAQGTVRWRWSLESGWYSVSVTY